MQFGVRTRQVVAAVGQQVVIHGLVCRDMPLPASGVAAVGHGTAADQSCRVFNVKVEEQAALHGGNSADFGESVGDTGARSVVQGSDLGVSNGYASWTISSPITSEANFVDWANNMFRPFFSVFCVCCLCVLSLCVLSLCALCSVCVCSVFCVLCSVCSVFCVLCVLCSLCVCVLCVFCVCVFCVCSVCVFCVCVLCVFCVCSVCVFCVLCE